VSALAAWKTSADIQLTYFGDDSEVPGLSQVSQRPVEPLDGTRLVLRSISVAELAQLPDFSYGLWDWLGGNESCPEDLAGFTAEECHTFESHMGPLNSNHFPPQSRTAFSYYHQMALERANECASYRKSFKDSPGRFDDILKECEFESLAFEAIGHHFLQDSWSMGHMWERWGT
jgi:hypothetical protein